MRSLAAPRVPTGSAPASSALLVRRKCACGGSAGLDGECDECRKEERELRRKATGGGGLALAPPIVHEVLRSPGRALEPAVGATLTASLGGALGGGRLEESSPGGRFGELAIAPPGDRLERQADELAPRAAAVPVAAAAAPTGPDSDAFAGVRVHTGPRAAASARAVGAAAYTVGRHLVFDSGGFDPGTASGRELLAHELVHVAQQRDESVRRATLRRKGTAGGFFSNIFRSIFRFGFSGKVIEQYLEHLRTQKKIEDDFDSDLKARQVVDDRETLGSLDTGVKVLLVEELLEGWTTRADEKSILQLLEGVAASERAEIVRRVRRARLWKNFSGKRLRQLQGLTLTAADFANVAFVDGLRQLSVAQLKQILATATDKDVRANLESLIELQPITTPLELGTRLDASGAARLSINGFDVTVLPDSRTSALEMQGRAETTFRMSGGHPSNLKADDDSGLLESWDPAGPIQARIQTIYGTGARQRGGADYGRGTTEGDVEAGNRTLRFHESQHGREILQFLSENPAPQVEIREGMGVEEFERSMKQYEADFEAFYEALKIFSTRRTDCPGKPMPAKDLKRKKLEATFCEELAKP